MTTDGGSIRRRAEATWEGGLAEGSGRLAEGGPAGGAPLTWATRTGPAGAPGGATSPEELIAAAHAGCYSMSLAATLEQAGHRAEHLDVGATCQAELGPAGLAIKAIELVVEGIVPGIGADEFRRLAGDAERSCPVSNSLRGNVEIRVSARLSGD